VIDLHPIRPGEILAAKAVIDQVFQGIWDMTYADVQAKYDPLLDMDDIQHYYFENKGTFLVLTEDGRVIGTGGLCRLDGGVAELKRIWLLKEYRGQGSGLRLVETLLEFARSKGYRRVQLTVATPGRQPEAISLYTSLGFQPFIPDSAEPGPLHMELNFPGSEISTI